LGRLEQTFYRVGSLAVNLYNFLGFSVGRIVHKVIQPIVDSMNTPQIISHYQKGFSLEDTRKKFNLPRSRVRNLLLEHGVLRHRGGQEGTRIPYKVLEKAVNDYITSQDSLSVVATRHPVGYQTLHNGLREVLGPRWEAIVDSRKPKVVYANRAETIRTIMDAIDQHGFETIKEIETFTGLRYETIRNRMIAGDVPTLKNTRCIVCTTPSDGILCSDQCRDIRIKCKTYKMTPEEVQGLADYCEICGSTKRLAVDHDHKTGKVRGRLCGKCNMALGLLNDNLDLLRESIKYLQDS
jgi:hypothetical protein